MADRKSAGGLPFVGNMTEGFDFVRKIWGVTGLPALPTASGITQFAQGLPQALPQMITPTLDVEELDKRIADLRAVEQWLALNANMLHATIQSLEVQRNTIATLKSFGGSMLASVTRGGAMNAPQMAANASGASYLQRAEARATARRKAAADAAAATPASLAAPLSTPAPAAPAAKRRAPARKRATRKADVHAAAAMPLNPAAWWGALQDQFARVAAVAAAEAARSEGGKRGGAGAPAAQAAAKKQAATTAKPGARAASPASLRSGGSRRPRQRGPG
jgi:hypothetical protein